MTLDPGQATRLLARMRDGDSGAREELLPLAEAMEASALAVDRQQASFTADARGTVRISIWENFAPFLTDHLGALREKLPEIELQQMVQSMTCT